MGDSQVEPAQAVHMQVAAACMGGQQGATLLECAGSQLERIAQLAE